MHYDKGKVRHMKGKMTRKRDGCMVGGREDGGCIACREEGWRDEGVMEGWWE